MLYQWVGDPLLALTNSRCFKNKVGQYRRAVLRLRRQNFNFDPTLLAARHLSPQIMCAEMIINGGIIMLGDHCGPDAEKTDATATVSYEVGKDKAVPLAKSFAQAGGEMMEEPSMQFWGQGNGGRWKPSRGAGGAEVLLGVMRFQSGARAISIVFAL